MFPWQSKFKEDALATQPIKIDDVAKDEGEVYSHLFFSSLVIIFSFLSVPYSILF